MRFRLLRAGLCTLAVSALAGCVAYGYPGDDGYGNPYGYGGTQPYPYADGYGGRTVRCESHDRRLRRCQIDTRYGVRLVHRLSNAACVQGRSWGWDRHGVWVDDGCRAEFAIGGGYGQGSTGYPGYDHGSNVRCESHDRRYVRCNARVERGVKLRHRLSDASCVQGSSWGWDRNGIWVDRGCRADFLVY